MNDPTTADGETAEVQGKEPQFSEPIEPQASDEKVETPPGFIPLDKHQKDINVQHKKYRDEERARVKQQDRAEKAESELAELKAQQAQTEVPQVPDPYSETYAQDVVKRDEAIRLQADQDAEIKRAEQDQLREREVRASEEQSRQAERVHVFDTNMVAHGLDPVGTKSAADTIVQYGINRTLEDYVLEDPDGPLLVNYLAQNPVELEELNGLSTYQLVNRLNGDIRAKASLLKPQTSSAPPPPTVISGGGVPEHKESWEEGAKYE